MAEQCIFCRIVAGEVPSDKVYQDEDFVAFRDISPQAPTHVLIIPRTHITSLAQLTEEQKELAGRLIIIAKRGYRLVINCGPEGGQLVPHLHLHLIGGRKLSDRFG